MLKNPSTKAFDKNVLQLKASPFREGKGISCSK